MEYTPDRWVIVKVTSKTNTHHRVFAGWYGGFTQGDSWKMNSGITHWEDKGDYYAVHGKSGNVYNCYKVSSGMSAYMSNVLYRFEQEAAHHADGAGISVVEDYFDAAYEYKDTP